MTFLKMKCMELGSLPTNTYLVWNEESGECLIMDPADEAERIENEIQRNGLNPAAICLTHGHYDHIGAVNELKRSHNLLVYMMKEEEDFVRSVQFNLSLKHGRPCTVEGDMFFVDGQHWKALGTEVTLLHTPGHTPGGACYYFPEQNWLFSGDTLFRASVGRSDLPCGNEEQLFKSIHEKLMPLPEETLIFPGHGPASSIGFEKRNNWFLA